MMAKLMKTLELHYPMIQFLIIADRQRSGALLLNWKLFLILCLEMHKIVGVVL